MKHPNKPQLDEATLKTIKNNILNLIDRTNVAFKGKAPYVISDQDSLTTDEIIFKSWHLGMLETVNLITDELHTLEAWKQPSNKPQMETVQMFNDVMEAVQCAPDSQIMYNLEQIAKKYGIEHVEVAPGIYQSREDYEANMVFDEVRDNRLQDELNDK